MKKETLYLVDINCKFAVVGAFIAQVRQIKGEQIVITSFNEGLTVSEYLKKYYDADELKTMNIKVFTRSEFDAFINIHASKLKTINPITQVKFNNMIEILPPCKWTFCDGVEMFFVSERICNDLVSWFCRIGADYYELVDDATMTPLSIAERLKGFIATLEPA
ncbi:hypothetical protein [Vibrio sp. 1180_3]|uniref:hypothetical protein n=1 Tax=Vibrio sp. 1180_3 TaxID=2528832 RepID=UPI002406E7DF|nr:hypothetical protein [Vibrio sp. 1180_3]